MSINIKSNLPSSKASIANCPFLAVSTSQPIEANINDTIFKLTSISSTTSTLLFNFKGILFFCPSPLISEAVGNSTLSENQKLLPFFNALLTPILPPSKLIIFLLIDSPKPVPLTDFVLL